MHRAASYQSRNTPPRCTINLDFPNSIQQPVGKSEQVNDEEDGGEEGDDGPELHGGERDPGVYQSGAELHGTPVALQRVAEAMLNQ